MKYEYEFHQSFIRCLVQLLATLWKLDENDSANIECKYFDSSQHIEVRQAIVNVIASFRINMYIFCVKRYQWDIGDNLRQLLLFSCAHFWNERKREKRWEKSGSRSVYALTTHSPCGEFMFFTFPERTYSVKLFTYVNARRFKSKLLCIRESTLKRRQNESNGNIAVLHFNLWLILAVR